MMILLNFIVRYPFDHAVPHGSDTFAILRLSFEIADNGQALWTLTPLSYFGLYPLSYPSGVPFVIAELQMLTGANWNVMPLLICFSMTLLLILSGFMFFRLFRLNDELAAVMSGLMAFSPIFVLFTYQQASARGFLVPVFVLSLYLIFWISGSMRSRFVMFLAFTFGAFAIHRSSFMIAVIESLAALIVFVGPFVPRLRSRVKLTCYVVLTVVAALLLLWPNIPFLRDVLSGIPELSLSYRLGEWEFRTGFLFQGDSIPILLGNLGANYVGGMGLGLLLVPFGLMSVYPTSVESRERDVFTVLALLVVTPLLWKSQYLQLVLLPFAYLLLGLAIHRRRRLAEEFGRILSRFRPNRRVHLRIPRATVNGMVAVFLLACLVFSAIMFVHRSNISVPNTGCKVWPTDSEVMTALYIKDVSSDGFESFVTASDMVSRRIQWFSRWTCPVIDSPALRADGYLEATRDDFVASSGSHDYTKLLFSFYNFEAYYTLNPQMPNRSLYYLSYGDIYGFFRLYFVNSSDAHAFPRVSTNEAEISVVIEINSMGSAAHNLYFGEGVLQSRFLASVSSDGYSIYQNDYCTAYLAAIVT